MHYHHPYRFWSDVSSRRNGAAIFCSPYWCRLIARSKFLAMWNLFFCCMRCRKLPCQIGKRSLVYCAAQPSQHAVNLLWYFLSRPPGFSLQWELSAFHPSPTTAKYQIDRLLGFLMKLHIICGCFFSQVVFFFSYQFGECLFFHAHSRPLNLRTSVLWVWLYLPSRFIKP